MGYHSIPGFHGENMRSLLVLICITSVSVAAPFGLGDIVNGIADAVSGNSDYDSPPYTVERTFNVGSDSFEERNYEGGKNWACTKRIINSENSDRGMFMKLFGYISGANIGENEIKMTVPVSMKMTGNKNSFEWFEEAKALDDMIATKGLQVNNEHFYANGYNSPMQFWNRRNEVWKVKL